MTDDLHSVVSPNAIAAACHDAWVELQDECAPADALILSSPASLLHFAGFKGSAHGSVGSPPWAAAPAALVLQRRGVTLLIADHQRDLVNDALNLAIATYNPVSPLGVEREFGDALSEAASGLEGVIGVEAGFLPITAVPDACARRRLLSIDQRTRRLTARKAAWERAHIETACTLASIGQRAVATECSIESTEAAAFSIAHDAMSAAAEQPVPIACDLVGGSRAELAGAGHPSSARLGSHRSTICDLAPLSEGFFGDSCSTLLTSNSTEQAKQICRAVDAAVGKGSDVLRPGVSVRVVDAVVRRALSDADLECPHYIGHGVGHSQLDYPLIDSTSQAVLEPGQIVALEPGVYLPGTIACRIEHVFAISDDGSDRLTTHDSWSTIEI